MSLTRICLFPYTQDVDFLLKYKDLMPEKQITSLVSFQEDRGPAMNKAKRYGISYSDDLIRISDCFDAVLLLDNQRKCRTDKYFTIIQEAESFKKPVFCSSKLRKELGLPEDKSIARNESEYEQFKKVFSEPTVPIVSVLGMGENCCKFETQILLTKRFKEKGYRVLSISSNDLGVLFGMESLPDVLFDLYCPFQEKIFVFQSFLNKQIKVYDPDVIILGIPGGISTFGMYGSNHYCELPLVITTAVSTDMGVLCSYYQKSIMHEEFSKLSLLAEYKYDVPLAACCISNHAIHCDDEMKEIEYYYLNEDAPPIDSDESLPVFFIQNKERTQTVIDSIIKQLEDFVIAF